MATQRIPSPSHPIADPETGRITTPWFTFLARLLTAGGGVAPGNGPFVVGTADPALPDAFVVTDSLSVDFDTATANQLKAYALVALLGALDGGSTSALAVRTDGVTIQINASNELEVIGGAGQVCTPLTDGDLTQPELIFALGDTITVCA